MMGMMFGHSDSHSGTADGGHVDHEGQREETRTIFGSGRTTLGIYGAPYLHLTKVGSKSATIIGGEMAAVINGSLLLGMSGGSLVGQIPLPQTVLINSVNETVNLKMNYMGFLIGYCAFSTSPVHFCLSSVIGSGQVDYTSKQLTSQYYNGGMMSGDRFLTLVPAVDLELNPKGLDTHSVPA